MGDTDRLWQAYFDDPSEYNIEALVRYYAPLVHQVVGKLLIHLPRTVEADELRTSGAYGLLQAIRSFNPEKGIFEVFARLRIRGAILDEIRKEDIIPRSYRKKSKQISEAETYLQEKLNRNPTKKEIAEFLGVDIEDLLEWERVVDQMIPVSLDGPVSDTEDIYGWETIEDKREMPPELIAEKKETYQQLANGIDKLPPRLKTVIVLCYYEGLTLKEIAMVLGVTEARISQMRVEAERILRSYIENKP